MNREAWLTEMAEACRPLFGARKLGSFRVTCGWPCRMATSPTRRRVGECHGPGSSQDGRFEIFISPVLHVPLEVAGTVCHELAHVGAGIDAGHGPQSRKLCRYVGLTKGRPTSVGPGPVLDEKLRKIADRLGPYPHSPMRPTERPKTSAPNVTAMECECGCRISMSKKMLTEYGPPKCACGRRFAA